MSVGIGTRLTGGHKKRTGVYCGFTFTSSRPHWRVEGGEVSVKAYRGSTHMDESTNVPYTGFQALERSIVC